VGSGAAFVGKDFLDILPNYEIVTTEIFGSNNELKVVDIQYINTIKKVCVEDGIYFKLAKDKKSSGNVHSTFSPGGEITSLVLPVDNTAGQGVVATGLVAVSAAHFEAPIDWYPGGENAAQHDPQIIEIFVDFIENICA